MGISLSWVIALAVLFCGMYCLGVIWRNGHDIERSSHLRDRVLSSVAPFTTRAKAQLCMTYASLFMIAYGAVSYGKLRGSIESVLGDYPLATELESTDMASIAESSILEKAFAGRLLRQHLGLDILEGQHNDRYVTVVALSKEVPELVARAKAGSLSLLRNPRRPGRFMTADALRTVRETPVGFERLVLGMTIGVVALLAVLGLSIAGAVVGFFTMPAHLQQMLKRRNLDRTFWNLPWEKFVKVKVERADFFARYVRLHPFLCYAYPQPEGKRVRLVFRGIRPSQEAIAGVLVPVLSNPLIRAWNRNVFFPQSLIDEIEAYKNQNSRRAA